MKKMIKVLGLVAIMTLSMSTQVFAGEWKQDNIGWWWQNNDNSYPVNRWEWVDGNHDGIAECYYFNENGYCLMATTTPDNYTVNESGAWTVDGVVQTKSIVTSTEDEDYENENVSKGSNQNEDTKEMSNAERERQMLRDMGLTDEQIDKMLNNPAKHSNYGPLS